MNPKQFLQIGGAVLVLVGILGLVGVIGPTKDDSIFGMSWWFDNGENWAHLLGGVVALIASFVAKSSQQRMLVLLVALVTILATVWGFLVGENFFGANLENPADNVLHLVIALWAFLAWRKGGQGGAMPMANQSMPSGMSGM